MLLREADLDLVCVDAGLSGMEIAILRHGIRQLRSSLSTRGLRTTTTDLDGVLTDMELDPYGPVLADLGITLDTIRSGAVAFEDLAECGLPLGAAIKLRHGVNLLNRRLRA